MLNLLVHTVTTGKALKS